MSLHSVAPTRATRPPYLRRLAAWLLRERLTAGPLIAVAVFVLALAATYAYITRTEDLQRRDALQRNLDSTQLNIRLKLQSITQEVETIARAYAVNELTESEFRLNTRQMLDTHPSVVAITRIDAERVCNFVVANPRYEPSRIRVSGLLVEEPSAYAAFEAVRDSRRAVYSNPYLGPNDEVLFEVQVPIIADGRFTGTITVIHSLQQMLMHDIPEQMFQRYSITFLDSGGNLLATNAGRDSVRPDMSYELPLDPPGHGVLIRAQAFRTVSDLPRNLLFAGAGLLSLLTIVILVLLLRDTRRRARAERALIAETAFRRAMENSVLTGMRAFDMQGRVTYVNPAFCTMIGWDESDLLGHSSPFPYWPPEQLDTNQTNMQLVLSGKAPPGGIEVELVRKNSSRLHARMYVSPLINESGQQTGWMTSMTDITEPKRIREELAAAHERFMTVLSSLEDAISVTVLPPNAPAMQTSTRELLFANNAYRSLFGSLAQGHLELEQAAMQELQQFAQGQRNANYAEFNELPVKVQLNDERWFEVRHQAIEWVDGRIVQLQVATDVTDVHTQEQAARAHQDTVQRSSRLITMGEMASTLAHELNQPLAAISNYCMGLVARARSGHTDAAELVPALEKTSQQAERAGKIIKRIREFVKRSEPKRKLTDPTTIALNAIALAELDAQQRGFAISMQGTPHLPQLACDPILIEQVLVNLLRNAIEAMTDVPTPAVNRIANQPSGARTVHLTISQVSDEQTAEAKIEFSVYDRGHGISPANMEKLFDAFFTTKEDGMGMGLNICRTIVELHHGRLWAQDNPGGGTIFKVQLPLQHGLSLNTPPQAQVTDTTVTH